MNQKFELTGFDLKLIAIAAMTFDHVGGVFFPEDVWFRIIGRITMPVMCYFIAEGYRYTHNKKNYARRLFLFAIVSELPFQMCFLGNYGSSGNVFWTLLLGMLALWAWDAVMSHEIWHDRGSRFLYRFLCRREVVAIIPVLAASYLANHFPMIMLHRNITGGFLPVLLWTEVDYGAYGVLAIFITGVVSSRICSDITKENGRFLSLLPKLIPPILLAAQLIWEESRGAYVIAVLLCIVILLPYRGQRGLNTKFAQYIFYFYYPIHLLLIALTAQIV